MTSAARDRIQAGIHFRSGERPPPCWRLLLLDVAPGTRPREARDAIASVMRLLGALRRGDVPELRGQPKDAAEATRDTFEDLAALIGFGRRLFDPHRHDPPLTTRARPAYLSYLDTRGAAFPTLPWTSPAGPTGEADVALQLTAGVQAAVNRAAVEVWKLIEDEGLPLTVASSFEGFGRPDGRGWLEFHDGVSNIGTGDRLAALTAAADPKWMGGGTYMAFLRLAVDMRAWRALDRGDQELVVGRDKLSGSPLVGVERDRSGRPRPVAGPPLPRQPSDDQLTDREDPPQTTDPLLEVSHIHRANQNRASPGAPGGLRIFRQGYDFLDSFEGGEPALGMNFVSFQSDLGTLQHLMHLPGWFGDVNFGGPADPGADGAPSPQLIRLLAGGLYAVPPRGRPFPGAGLFSAR